MQRRTLRLVVGRQIGPADADIVEKYDLKLIVERWCQETSHVFRHHTHTESLTVADRTNFARSAPIGNWPENQASGSGFEPIIVTSGEEAVSLLKAHAREYRALVTDINLKGSLDEREVAKHAREIKAEFPIVYTSGSAAADWTSKGVPKSVMLSEPFAPVQLLTAIASLLNSTTPTA
jgi:CheY-like chemotaxis protein